MTKRALFIAALTCLLAAHTSAYAQTAVDEQQVSFDSVPDVVQGALTANASGASSGAAASVWRGLDRGSVIYTGRVVDVDGSSRIIDVDETGRVRGVHAFAAPFAHYVDPGQYVAWETLTPGVQKTISDNARGARVSSIVEKKAANGLTIYVATTRGVEGDALFVETTADGALIGVKDVPD